MVGQRLASSLQSDLLYTRSTNFIICLSKDCYTFLRFLLLLLFAVCLFVVVCLFYNILDRYDFHSQICSQINTAVTWMNRKQHNAQDPRWSAYELLKLRSSRDVKFWTVKQGSLFTLLHCQHESILMGSSSNETAHHSFT